ncbi:MAG: DNA repair protein RadA [Candidatus Omnitrophota bacterium]
MKPKTVFACQNCGYTSAKWLGRCPDCGGWNCLIEEKQIQAPARTVFSFSDKPRSISDIDANEQERFNSGIEEFDRILGGGIVPGSVVLVGGDPGIGKSTLLLQISDNLSTNAGKPILYISGEESMRQTKLRADRLGRASKNLYIVSECNLERMIEYISELKPLVCIIDSIQTTYNSSIGSAPGSVSQVRECAAQLTMLAKSKGISIFLVGHVTKEGTIAGPRVMEHIVDTVLYFEGEKYSSLRILRSQKNRFGSTNEVGIFEMTSSGLIEVKNPSEVLLSERPAHSAGSFVVPLIEGTRPLLVEIQALVSPSSFSVPTRRCVGVDFNRTILLSAVLEKRFGFGLSKYDLFVSAASGLRVEEPAADLAIALAIASSAKDRASQPTDTAIGEVGLGGEVRSVGYTQERINEAKKLGFKRFFVSKNSAAKVRKSPGIEIIGISSVKDGINIALS